ncbi:hypothetical protein D3C72_2113370 [compost metagenome]
MHPESGEWVGHDVATVDCDVCRTSGAATIGICHGEPYCAIQRAKLGRCGIGTEGSIPFPHAVPRDIYGADVGGRQVGQRNGVYALP